MNRLKYILTKGLLSKFGRNKTRAERFHINFNEELVFHDLFGKEFRGNTALEVQQEFYKNSLQGVPDWLFSEWKEYQIKILKINYGVRLKEIDTEQAARKWLVALVKYGFTEIGPLRHSEKD